MPDLEEKGGTCSATKAALFGPRQEEGHKRLAVSIGRKILAWLPGNQIPRGAASPHFWAIAGLMAVLALIYYADHTGLALLGGFFAEDLPHDLHRALFVIPVVYAAVSFRFWGAIVTSLAFLCIVLPRTLYSPYTDPALRTVIFVLVTACLGILCAALMDCIDEEREIIRRSKESRDMLVHVDRLTSLGQMAASIAHEINNPLAGVLTYTKLLARKVSSDSIKKEEILEYLSKMEAETGRCSRIVRNLLDFARQKEPALTPVDINQVVEQVLAMVGHQAELQKVAVVKEFGSGLPKVMADFDQLQQVFTNLTLNAIQAMPRGGKLTVRTKLENSQVRVDVEDTGHGIPKENMDKIFTPFFTTKEKGKGVGLGLAVSHAIIERHKGSIKVQSEVGKGTTFSVYLSVHHEESEQKTGERG